VRRRARSRALACVADVVRVAAREQDDIAATHALDVRVAVDPKHEFALFNDVQGADIGEADRESPQRSVRNDPFSAQTDAPEQLREQVVRLAICVEAERGVLERWRIGKLSRRSEQIGWRRWTIGKMFRRSGHCPYAFLGLRSTNSEWSDQSDGLGTRLGRSVRCQLSSIGEAAAPSEVHPTFSSRSGFARLRQTYRTGQT
jgi:hypothetical protein